MAVGLEERRLAGSANAGPGMDGEPVPALAWPDLLVGPGLLGGSTVLSLEQLLLDVELFRRCVRLRRGIDAALEEAVEDAMEEAGPGGDFLARPSTRRATHAGEWHRDQLGVRDPWERWEAAGRPDIVDEARRAVAETLAAHRPLPMDEATARELAALVDRAAGLRPTTSQTTKADQPRRTEP